MRDWNMAALQSSLQTDLLHIIFRAHESWKKRHSNWTALFIIENVRQLQVLLRKCAEQITNLLTKENRCFKFKQVLADVIWESS